MTRTRRSFTDEFKREAVKLCKQPGSTTTHIAKDLGIEPSVLRRWVTRERGGVLDLRPNRPLRSEAATEVELLQRELRQHATTKGKKPIGARTFTGWAHEIFGSEIEGFQLKRIRSGVETLLAARGVSREVRGHFNRMV